MPKLCREVSSVPTLFPNVFNIQSQNSTEQHNKFMSSYLDLDHE